MSFGIGFWRNRTHNLSRMSMRDLVAAFFTYPAVLVYLVLTAASLVVVAMRATAILPLIVAALLAALAYPLVWYLLHRFVLHGRYLYKSRLTAALWKRIHFDHHQDPHDLRVLFGALYTTLPTIGAVTVSLGWLVGGLAGAAAGLASGLLTTCFYEFCHCIEHLNSQPRSAYLQRIKRLHLAHHFHNETGNFGITSFFCDRLLGTLYLNVRDRPKSPTVFNIGYTADEARRYPWVAALSPGTRGDDNPRRFREGDLDRSRP